MSAPPPKPAKASPMLPQKPPVIPQKPPSIPSKPSSGGLPRKPVRATSTGNLNRISKTPPPSLPIKSAESPETLSQTSPTSKTPPDSPKSSSSRPSSKKGGKFKRKLFSTLRGVSNSSEKTNSQPNALSPSSSPNMMRASSPAAITPPAPKKVSTPPPKTLAPVPAPVPAPRSAPNSPMLNNSYSSMPSLPPPTGNQLRNTAPNAASLMPSGLTKPNVMPRIPSQNSVTPSSVPNLTKSDSRSRIASTEPTPVPNSPKFADLSVLDQKRKKIVEEMLKTEEDYVATLDTLVNGYQRPLAAKAETTELPDVTKMQIRAIFSNVEQLLPMNQLLLSDIKLRVQSWHPTQLVGDIFEKTGPFFKIYNMYGNNYDKAQEVLDKCQLDPAFTQQVEILESKVKSLRLPNLLIQPIQRIPRYNLLIRDLLAKTPEEHPDHKHLTAALSILEGVMEYLDKNITQMENSEKMLKFSSVKGAEALVQPHRQMVQEFTLNMREQDKSSQVGTLKKKFKSKGLFKDVKLTIWLFNDVLVHLTNTKSKKKTNIASTKHTWPLELVWIKDIPEIEPSDTKFPYSFLLVGPRTTYTLRFPDPPDKNKWMKVLTDAIQTCLTEENSPDAKNMTRYGTYEFPDKDRGRYQGWWKFGKIHGQGVYDFHGNRYTGQYEYNQKSGTGTMELCSGEVYQGEWKEDFPHGQGTIQYPNNDRYDGEWVEGLRSGRGTHYYANGDKYTGYWANNVPHGEGHYITIEGHDYKGGWKNSVFHGSGLLLLPNGKQYEGEFRDGYRHGEGRMDYANGQFYVGQWQYGRRHGKGVFFCDVEGSYEGDFREDAREGHGTMQYSNGDVYIGHWKRNLYHGNGSFTCASGGMLSYEGQWDSGSKHGKGVMIYRNESKYEGHFREDLPHGHGVYSSRGVTFDGKWEEGRKQGKLSISVGQSKISAQCNKALMDEGKIHSFFVFPDTPVVHLNL